MSTNVVIKAFSEFAIDKVLEEKSRQGRKDKLQLAVFAWNFAYWDDIEKREEYINQAHEYYKRNFNSINKSDEYIKLLRKYIDEKRENYYLPKNQILDSKLSKFGNKIAFHLKISEHDGFDTKE